MTSLRALAASVQSFLVLELLVLGAEIAHRHALVRRETVNLSSRVLLRNDSSAAFVDRMKLWVHGTWLLETCHAIFGLRVHIVIVWLVVVFANLVRRFK